MQSKLRFFAGYLIIFSLIFSSIFVLSSNDVSANSDNGNGQGQDTCPSTGDWHKVDDLSGKTFVYSAPYGKAVAEVCYKASTTVVQYDVEPPMQTVTVESSVKNQNDKVQDLSHASFRLVDFEEKEETHNFKLTSMCYDEERLVRVWRVFHNDLSDEFYPVQLGYRIYSGEVGPIGNLFGFTHTFEARFSNPYIFNTPYNGNGQTVVLFWKDSAKGEWIQSDTKASNNTQCEPEYEECSATVTKYGEWSEWMTNPEDRTEEYRERFVYTVDSKDNDVNCQNPTKETEARYKVCSSTVRSYGEWSAWMDDPQDSTKEYREQKVYILDSQDETKQCARPVTIVETRYKVCSSTYREFGDWSEWKIDPEDESMEYREREATAIDSQDSETVCAGPIVQKETRDRVLCEWDSAKYADDPLCVEPEGNGDVLGESTQQVKGATTVVLASTGAYDNSVVFLVQSILLFVTGASLIYVGKEYINRY